MRDTVTAPGLSGEASGCAGVVDTTGGARGAQVGAHTTPDCPGAPARRGNLGSLLGGCDYSSCCWSMLLTYHPVLRRRFQAALPVADMTGSGVGLGLDPAAQ
jgi:hypothetical protein